MNRLIVSFAVLLVAVASSLFVRTCAADSVQGSILLSPKQFTSKFIAAAKQAEPGATITMRKPLKLLITRTDGVGNPDLGNAYAEYRKTPQDLKEIIARYVSVIMNVRAVAGNDKPLDQLLPVVQGEAFMAAAERQLDELRQKGAAPSMGGVVNAKLADGLYVLYAFDRPDRLSYLTEDDALKMKLTEPQLRNIALSNLKRLYLPKLKVSGKDALYQLVLDGNFESSMILLIDELNKSGNFGVQGDLVTYVLARDTVFITGSEERGAQAIAETFAEKADSLPYFISSTPYVLHSDNWVPYHQ